MGNEKMSGFDYINKHYGLQLSRGSRVAYSGDTLRLTPRYGEVARADGAHIYIRFDDAPSKVVGPFHPTWEMEQLEPAPLPQPPSTSQEKSNG
jgi:hypothetical protein